MTELELYALRAMPALAAAQHLMSLSRADLVVVCQRLGLRVAHGDYPEGLRQKIMSVTHPAPAAARRRARLCSWAYSVTMRTNTERPALG